MTREQSYSASETLSLQTDWWIKLDKPFEALAACQELVKALDYPDGPEAFPSSLPIHQDGTCNGLQYYAALGRDERGGRSVNLIPHPDSNKPQDVYSEVLDVVKQIVEKKKKPEIAYQHPDVLLTRKTVKTTVRMRAVHAYLRLNPDAFSIHRAGHDLCLRYEGLARSIQPPVLPN